MSDDRRQTEAEPVKMQDTLIQAFGRFRFGIGELVVHKTRPKLRWAVLAQQLVRDEGGVCREYQVGSIAGEAGGTMTAGESELEEYPGYS